MTKQVQELHIDVGSPTGVTVAPDMWGMFFEDINTSLDGGLNAELIRNGDFEFNVFDNPAWGPLTAWSTRGDGSLEIRGEDPVHENNRHYARVTGPMTLTNQGWDPIAVAAGAEFVLTFATWGVAPGTVTARITDTTQQILAQVQVPVSSAGWTWQEAWLVAHADGLGTFELEVPNGVIVEVDVVSLRPTDGHGKALTFRQDLVEALRELAPSFVRFPGGCVAHGIGLNNMYHWKDSVGPRFTRKHLVNTWGYHQSRQVGYLEYFELCIELGATPMPIVAAGVCCQNLRGRAAAISMTEMPAYVQDILDLVEFANGATDTTWGRVRAELGHEKPFGLRYLGVGNEDEITEDFKDRYQQISRALAEHYPEITVIGTVGPQPFGADYQAGWEFARQEQVAIVDEHAYRTPRWFHQNIDRYDTYERGGPGVYFGEYAARTNTVRSALAEAAFMIGMERNGDLVKLASYAPLLGKVGGTQWVPDLIYFDSDSVIRTTSYQVHALFGQIRGQENAEVVVRGAAPIPVSPIGAGGIRVRSKGAVFELSGLQIDGTAEDRPVTTGDTPIQFVTDSSGTELDLARYDLETGTAAQTVIDLVATRRQGTEGLIIALGGTGNQDYFEVELGGWQNKLTVVNQFADGISDDIDGPTMWRGVRTDQAIAIRIVLERNRIQVLVDGDKRHDVTLDRRPEQRVVAGVTTRVTGDGSTAYVLRLVNASDEHRSATLSVAGNNAPLLGELNVLGGAGPDEGEPFARSPFVAQTVAVTGASGLVQFDVPPWSFLTGTLHEQN